MNTSVGSCKRPTSRPIRPSAAQAPSAMLQIYWFTASGAGNLVGPNPKLAQRVRAKGCRDRNIGSVAAARKQHSADPGHVVPWVERTPFAAEIGFDPSRKIAWRIGWQRADITEIPCAVARRDVQGAAEGDGQVGEVAAHAAFLVVGF